jgi:hypothetical protein
MNATIKGLIENKKEIDNAFLEMLVKIQFLNEKKQEGRKEDYGKWFNIAVNEYKEIKCKGCCNQELETCSA